MTRIRVVRGRDIAMGPGKADLLEAIEETGSIAAAAKSLDMSYMRAWSLVRVMNRSFASPLVEAERGGAGRGGARLTKRGSDVVRLYRRMERASERATATQFAALERHLR